MCRERELHGVGAAVELGVFTADLPPQGSDQPQLCAVSTVSVRWAGASPGSTGLPAAAPEAADAVTATIACRRVYRGNEAARPGVLASALAA